MKIDHLLDTLAASSQIVPLLSSSAELAAMTKQTTNPKVLLHRLDALAGFDEFAVLAAIESLAALRHTSADDRLLVYLDHPVELIRRHATWRLRHRPANAAAYRPLVRQVTIGGITTMHAHRTLRAWAPHDEVALASIIIEELETTPSAAARARLVDTLGVIGGPAVDEYLRRMASDSAEHDPARIAAIGALSQRPQANATMMLRGLARVDNDLGTHAALAVDDLEAFERAPQRARSGSGLRVSQLSLTGQLDPQLSRGGQGDTGGVASLLVSVGEALASRDDVDHVLTIGRGSLTDAVAAQLLPDDGNLAYGVLAVGDDARPADEPAATWEHLPAIERGILRVLRNRVGVDILHLRMADVGTLAGALAAKELGVDTCFSLAGDPHNVIQSLQDQGHVDRNSFIDSSTTNNFWFRARMVEGLAREASRLALFPRSGKHRLADRETPSENPPSDGSGPRSAVVSEGIDLTLVRRAEQELGRHTNGASPRPEVLAKLAMRIPPHRRHLPLLISVGRLNPIKGMDRVAAAWASDPSLYENCTLVIVGGSQLDPTPTEQGVLAAIDEAVPHGTPARAGLVLFGGRSRPDVALLLAAAADGLDDCWAPGGTYVDGAYKEEFGLAVIEALAAGLVVIAPNVGGPPTYVEHGVTGVLVDPADDLASGLQHAFTLVEVPGRRRRAFELVEERYSVAAMAEQLVDLYRPQPALL